MAMRCFMQRQWKQLRATDITVVVKDGEDVSQAADELEKKGLIKNIYAFLFQSRFYDYDKIYPGTYTFNTSMTSRRSFKN